MRVTYMLCVRSSIYKTVNSNANLNTKLTNHYKRDGTRAKGCDHEINNG